MSPLNHLRRLNHIGAIFPVIFHQFDRPFGWEKSFNFNDFAKGDRLLENTLFCLSILERHDFACWNELGVTTVKVQVVLVDILFVALIEIHQHVIYLWVVC